MKKEKQLTIDSRLNSSWSIIETYRAQYFMDLIPFENKKQMSYVVTIEALSILDDDWQDSPDEDFMSRVVIALNGKRNMLITAKQAFNSFPEELNLDSMLDKAIELHEENRDTVGSELINILTEKLNVNDSQATMLWLYGRYWDRYYDLIHNNTRGIDSMYQAYAYHINKLLLANPEKAVVSIRSIGGALPHVVGEIS